MCETKEIGFKNYFRVQIPITKLIKIIFKRCHYFLFFIIVFKKRYSDLKMVKKILYLIIKL